MKAGIRIDQFLKFVCLFKSRSAAQQACKKGYVWVEGRPARPSDRVVSGQVLELRLPTRLLRLRVREVPARQVPCRDAPRFYEVLETQTRREIARNLLDELLEEMGGETPLNPGEPS